MASKRFKRFKSSNAEVGVGTKEIDVISQLEGIPHVLEQIFLHLDTATLLETDKVSTTWKQLISSLNLWKIVWKRNMGMSQPWKALSARMEHLNTQLWERMKEGDSSSYREACRYVQRNIGQIPHSAMKNVNFHVLPTDNDCRRISTNEKYVFIGGDNKVVIFNRWTRERVKEIDGFLGSVQEMQLNERFLAVRYKFIVSQIDVYDAQKLVLIQTIRTSQFGFTKFVLGSDVLVICSKQGDHWTISVYRWNPSTARFVFVSETEHQQNVIYNLSSPNIYVDEKYLILDFTDTRHTRFIQVYILETMQLIREKQFITYGNIRREYHDGAIVVETCTAEGQPSCVALWDVDKNTVEPMADHPSQFDYSFAMTHHPFQIVAKKIENQTQSLLVQRGQPTRNDVIAMPSQCCNLLFFDGLQMIAKSYSQTPDGQRKTDIVIADLIG